MKKWKSTAAFTLIEMLACVITLLLICMICGAGLNLTAYHYNRSMFETNSQMLEATLHTVMGDVFRYSYDIVTEADDNPAVVSFYSDNYSALGQLRIKVENGQFILYNDIETERLISKNAYAESLRIVEDSFIMSYNNGVFSGSYVIESTLVEDLERTVTFQFRTIMDK